jgi:hypothetical protein
VTCAAACVARITPAEMIAILSLDRIDFLSLIFNWRGAGIVYAI